ncbi:MAG: GDSL-type esterase/lipase family protein, partial [Candidatus Pacebacteria bacterium]|nr:GDSL-type esterase/lipase family protein [Candidatus Paceibacterota bacterium]
PISHLDYIVPIETEIHKIRVCTMGDSITAGHPGYWAESGTGDPQSQYQYWLQRRLGDDFEVQNNGYGSDTTLRCLNRFDRDVVQRHPQYVIIQAGTNDIHWALAEAKDDQAYLDNKMEEAKINTIAMVNIAIDNNIIPIIGTLIPRTSAKGIYRQALWDFNDWIINYCNGREDVFYVDFYSAGKQNIPPTPLEEPNVPGNMNPLYDGDSRFDEYGNLIRRGQGVHPSVVGYKLMAEVIPLSLFKSLVSDVKIYLDENCTIEEESTVYADTTKEYHMKFKNLNRGRIRTTSRFIKNIGNNPVLYSLYPTEETGLDIKFSTEDSKYNDYINGIISSSGVVKIDIQLDVPKFGEVPEIALNLATRVMKN